MNFFTRNFRKPQLIPLLFIIASTITLSSLGTWQLERLQWKNGLIAEIAQAQALEPLQVLPDDVSDLKYRRVRISGTFNYDKALHLIGRQQGNFPGYFMLTPFTLSDGRTILVNRGFAPPGKETRPEGVIWIDGVIRPAREKRYFAPENMPEKNVWFYENIPAMAQATGLTLAPIIIEQVGQTPNGQFPILGDGKISLLNDHLSYAITWYSVALIGIIMFGFYYRKV